MKKVLVIDDDESILEVVTLVLEAEGYEVETANSGRYIHRLLQSPPDLIILDILLSGEDGRNICSYLKNQDLTRNIPVIMFSAHYKGDVSHILNQSKADSFLAKPFDINDLTHLVKLYTSPEGAETTLSA